MEYLVLLFLLLPLANLLVEHFEKPAPQADPQSPRRFGSPQAVESD
ncbi:hypothetical protein [Deinococcus cellulosilyticus]|uniref:Uncharacterized protein n=1 Tax=Deinococcus cellulosilyticus (strain DSM 18568 / NBRC 106333 / KACC 11606 / 5516J-15) TaxID=1223518 RepID=A0A511N4W6_DEIC1|nr:hypothetical protein [Deinococcus cellulosilyticus]GEM47885.1 hypothetical protein DC3_35200 [Deinococcus cellulosilyticus NBRC 106333 = KACC 11606]